MPTEQEPFTIDHPAREVEDIWQALQRALATMDMRDADDATHMARLAPAYR